MNLTDEKTAAYGYPLPHPNNLLQQDVERIRSAFSAVDGDIQRLDAGVAEQADNTTKRLRRIKLNQLLGEQLINV